MTEWLPGYDAGGPIGVRTLTHLLRLDCSTGLLSGHIRLKTGRTYLLFLTRGALPGAAGENQPDFVLSDPYSAAWLLDEDDFVYADPRVNVSERVRYHAPAVLAALRDSIGRE